MSPTASSKAKVFRSVSVGDAIHLAEPTHDPSGLQVQEAPPTLPAAAPPSVAAPPQGAAAPVVVAVWAAPPTRNLHGRAPGGSGPLPDKPCLSSFSSLTPPPQEEAAPADPGPG